MESYTKKTKITTHKPLVKSRLLRYGLVLLSMMQAHWPTLVAGAATAAAATLFGEKGHLSFLSEEIETLIAKDNPQETIDYLKNKIDEYHQWKNNYQKKESTEFPSYLYLQLAKAQESAGDDIDKVIATYKTVLSYNSSYGAINPLIEALIWLYQNTSEKEYLEAIQNKLISRNNNARVIAIAFEATNHWPAFEFFLDSSVSEVDNPVSWAYTINHGLKKNNVWQDRFLKYSQSNPRLTGYVFQQYKKNAQHHLKQKDYRKAVEIYRKIVRLCGPNQDKITYEYKICQILFLDGQYKKSIVELDLLIKDSQSSNRILTQQAILLKGRSFVHLGQMDRAIDTFLTLMIEYPEAKQAPKANFFMGYSYMLQGKFELATESLTLVVKDYPKSSYASKARICLSRIKSMGQ